MQAPAPCVNAPKSREFPNVETVIYSIVSLGPSPPEKVALEPSLQPPIDAVASKRSPKSAAAVPQLILK